MCDTTVIADNYNSKSTATISIKEPKIDTVSWGLHVYKKGESNPIDTKKIDKIANATICQLCITTKESSNCSVIILIECESWGAHKEILYKSVTNTDKTELKDSDIVDFTPNKNKWTDISKKSSKINTKVYLIATSATLSDGSSSELVEKFKTNNDAIGKYSGDTVMLYNVFSLDIDIDYCGHGMEYRKQIYCTKYSSNYGPIYHGKTKVDKFTGWSDLVTNGDVTETEKKAISAMADNEGNLEAVQSYDSEIVSVGAMQKTINTSGEGELPKQIYEFKESNTSAWEKHQCCFENHKWEFIKENNRYKAKYNGAVASSTTKTAIRTNYTSEVNGNTSEKNNIIEPFIKLSNDPEFHKKQILDFIARMRESIDKKISGYSNRKISEYIKSALGMATVLDHSVNRPAHVLGAFKDSLDEFYKKEEYKDVDKDPSNWGDNHSTYEKAILDIYGPLRGTGSYTMTNAESRYNALKTKL